MASVVDINGISCILPNGPAGPIRRIRRQKPAKARQTVRADHAEEIVGLARDQMDLRVGALPTEIAVEAGDSDSDG